MNVGISVPLPAYLVDVGFMARKAEELVPERHPLLLAKEVSTLDLFSGGRFLFGIGAGWLREETQIMGGDYRDLIRRLRDAGANRVIVRPPTVKTESEMAAGLTRIAEAVLR